MNLSNDFNSLVQQTALKNTELDVDVKDLYNKTKQASTSIQSIQSAVDDINDDITDVEGDITTINNSISTINTSITSLDGSVSSLNNSVSSINGSITSLGNDVQSLNNSVSTINGNITTINSSIGTINTQISSMEKVTVLYDKKSNDSAINRGYTAGILGQTNLSIDLTGYQYVRIYFTIYNYSAYNVVLTSKAVVMSLDNPISNMCYVNDKVEYLVSGALQNTSFCFYASYNVSSKIFTPVFFYGASQQPSGYYFDHRIEGVK